MKKIFYFSFVTIGFVLVFAGIGMVAQKDSGDTQVAHAVASATFSGWAWAGSTDAAGAGGIGWISLNSSNCDTNSNGFIDTNAITPGCGGSDNSSTPVKNYAVSVDTTNLTTGGTGALTGYAWSSNIGWINFAPSGPYPTGTGTTAAPATIDWTPVSGKWNITGWARACAVFLSGCSGALKPNTGRGDWDGWIALSGQNTASAPYGLTVDSSTYAVTGYGWAGDLVGGWINFAPTNGHGGVMLQMAPVINTFTVNGGSSATAYYGDSVTLAWSTTGATGCTASGDWTGPVGTSSAGYTEGPLTNYVSSYTYSLQCMNSAGRSPITTVTVSFSYCGDGVVQTANGEACDGSNLNGNVCPQTGEVGLSCNGSCQLDTSTCAPSCVSTGTQCGDCVDNDADGLIDSADPGCWLNVSDPTTYDASINNENHCGDNTCQPQWGETPASCYKDCSVIFNEH